MVTVFQIKLQDRTFIFETKEDAEQFKQDVQNAVISTADGIEICDLINILGMPSNKLN